MKRKEIKVMPYDPLWAVGFEEEGKRLQEILGNACVSVHHIGSTAVPGLEAKEDIDIALEVRDLRKSFILKEHGYRFKGEFNIPRRFFFSKNGGERKVNLHVVPKGHPFIKLNLCFRDALRDSKELRKQYASLKRELLKDPNSYIKQDGAFSGYNHGKNAFIKSVLQKAGYREFHVNFCMHSEEKKAYGDLLGMEPFQQGQCFICYKGIEIVAAAYVTEKEVKKLVAKEGEAFLRSEIQKWLELSLAI